MASASQLVLLLVVVIGSGRLLAANAERCEGRIPKETWVPIVSSSCEKRPIGNGSCLRSGLTFNDADFEHRGSELNNGRFAVTTSNEECCKLCRETQGCRTWTRFQEDKQYNDKGTCWIKSSAPAPTPKKVGLTGGLIESPVEDSAPCNQEIGVGIRGIVAYNNPRMLHAEQWEICCSWCQADNEFCTGWMWSSTTGFCRLYGNVVDDSNKHLCRDCVSGTRTAARDLVKHAPRCKDGGSFDIKYIGSSRVVLAPAGAFTTKTSKECCGLCDAIKDCRSWSWRVTEECILNTDIPQGDRDTNYFGGVARQKVCEPEDCEAVEDVYMEGKDLYCSQYAAPSELYLVVENYKQCCMRCQEIPECIAWSFSRGKTDEAYSSCSLKVKIPNHGEFANIKGAGLGSAWSGIIRSRCAKHEIEAFVDRVADAERARRAVFNEQEQLKSKKEKKSFTLPIVVAVVIVIAILVVCCIVMSMGYWIRKSRRMEAYNAKHMEAIRVLGSTSIPGKQHHIPGPPEHLASYSPSLCSSNARVAELSMSTVNPSPVSRSYDVSSTPLTVRELEYSELRLQFLKQRMGTLKGPGGRFSSSMDHYEDTEWLSLNDEMSNLQLGTELGGKYVIEGGIHMGDNSIVMNAKQKFNSSSPVVLKFFRQQKYFDVELSLYEQELEFPYIPQVFDVYDPSTVESWGLPPLACIVMERGNSNLSEWLQCHLRVLDHMDQRNILFKICKAVQYLHEHGIVHRDLKPENIVIFSDTLSWKLIDFGSWAKKGATAQLEYTLRYAAPELLAAHATEDVIQVMPSTDMWSLGLIFWEVLTGDPLFGQEYSKEEVMAMLLGVEGLPFEKHPEMWHGIQHGAARRLVGNLLQRNPIKRWNVQKVLQNGYFMSAPDTVQLAEGHQEYANALKVIAGAVERVDHGVQQVKNVAIENLKQTMGSILIACFSFYEIDPAEVTKNQQMGLEFAEMYANNSLKMTKALIEPSYNVFKRAKEEPAMLLRLERKHMLKITLMYGGDAALDLPISEIVFARILPSGSDGAHQEMEVFMMFHKGHLMEGVGLWSTTDHNCACLKLVGNTSIEICIGLRMNGTDDIVEVRKTVDLRMHQPQENFNIVKQFYRTKGWYSNLPPWAKIYIHGAVAVVSLASKTLL